MLQRAIILSNAYDKQSGPVNGGEFYNMLNRPLEFDRCCGEVWRVGLGEIMYQPNSWQNVRDGMNSIDLEVSNMSVMRPAENVLYMCSWTFIDEQTARKGPRS